jgi:hypothetical protein
LLELGHDPRRLGGELGITTVLHTWTQKIEYHPHLHCIVSGGGLSADGGSWIPTRPNFLFPTQVMGRLFRGKMLDALRRAASCGKLRIHDPARFAALIASLYRKRWHIYSKRPFGGAEQVIQYLGQYTHRVAISNHRLVAMGERGVTFRTKSGELVTLEGTTFVSRWLSHILPPGFTKIRHYGLMSASHATTRLPMARRLLAGDTQPDAATPTASPDSSARSLPTANWRDIVLRLTGIDLGTCPCCGSRAIERRPLPRQDLQARSPPRAA